MPFAPMALPAFTQVPLAWRKHLTNIYIIYIYKPQVSARPDERRYRSEIYIETYAEEGVRLAKLKMLNVK